MVDKMKDLLKQIKFVHFTFLPIYGIRGVDDYETKVSLAIIKNDTGIVKKLNDTLPEIKQLFLVKDFNLHKTNNKIGSPTQAYAILKKILNMCNIMFEIVNEDKINFVRLISRNLVLYNFIHEMSDIRKMSDSKNEDKQTVDNIFASNYDFINEKSISKNQINLEDLENNILKEVKKKVRIPIYLIHDMNLLINNSMTDMRGFTIKFLTSYDDNFKLLNNSFCKLFIDDVAIEEHALNSTECNKISFLSNIIIPASTIKFSRICVRFSFTAQYWKIITDSDIVLEICYNELIFKKKFQQRMLAPNARICLEHEDKKIEIAKGEMVYSSKNKKFISEIEIFDPFVEKRFTINNKKYCRIRPQITEDTPNMLIALVKNKVDAVVCKIINVPLCILFFTQNKTQYIITARMIRHFDAISDLKFVIPNFNPKNCKILCQQKDHNEIEFQIKFNKKTGTISCIDDISNRYIKLVPDEVRIIIEMDKNNDIFNICRNIKFSYDALVIGDSEERRKVDDYIIDVDSIVDES